MDLQGILPGYPYPVSTSLLPEYVFIAAATVPSHTKKTIAEALFRLFLACLAPVVTCLKQIHLCHQCLAFATITGLPQSFIQQPSCAKHNQPLSATTLSPAACYIAGSKDSPGIPNYSLNMVAQLHLKKLESTYAHAHWFDRLGSEQIPRVQL